MDKNEVNWAVLIAFGFAFLVWLAFVALMLIKHS